MPIASWTGNVRDSAPVAFLLAALTADYVNGMRE
jgi:hypothetical protein